MGDVVAERAVEEHEHDHDGRELQDAEPDRRVHQNLSGATSATTR